MKDWMTFRGKLAFAAALAWSGLSTACTDVAEPGDAPGSAVPCTVNCSDPSPLGSADAGWAGAPISNPLAGGDAGAGPVVAPPSAGAGVAPTSGGLPCAVKQIVQERCGTCHGEPPTFGAPMALTTHSQFAAPARSDASRKTYEMVKARINTAVAAALMPPASSDQLSAAELSTLNAWLDQGAPPSGETCTPAPTTVSPQATDTSGLDCYKFLAHADGDKNSKFKVGLAVDKYYNMAFKAPWQGVVYGQLVRPVIDNDQVIHHWLLYEEAGTDGSVTETIGQHAGGQLITGWAPGGTPVDFRKHGDVGFELPATSYVVEFHYNSADANAVDASGVEVCVKKTPPQHIASMSWLGYDNWIIAGDLGGPRNSWTGICAPAAQEPIHILFVTPHMHTAGVRMKSIINGSNGQRVLHDKPFNFAYQVTYETEEVLMPGETITTTCEFSEPKSMGQATSDEMCYLFTYAYPKGALVDDGLFGTFQHGSGVCLGQ